VLGPVADAKPNTAHLAVARLESHCEVVVVTQNVDNLHQEAGSTTVHEIHGSLLEMVTLSGRFVRLIPRSRLKHIARKLEVISRGWFPLPRLIWTLLAMLGMSLRGFTRPRVVLFGEAMAEPDWSKAMEACRSCDVLIVVGTSGTVMPAALLPMEAQGAGAKVITIDPTRPEITDIWLRGAACEIVPALASRATGDEA
jgi:NAD-dependent deacetylase